MEKFDGLYNIRATEPNDKNFVIATFLRSVYHDGSWFSKIPEKIFMATYRLVIERLYASTKCLVVVACLAEDPDVILGFSIVSVDGDILHWVYVKKKWRRHGIATRLVPSTVTTITHLNNLGDSIMKIRKLDLIFNPFLA
jgi:GNAT superfamily N-acetyltransferase